MFSSDSRWDRHTPDQLREESPIDVEAVFLKGKIVPKTFIYNGRKYLVREITYRWEEKRGGQVLHYFAVTDNVNIYYIYFNGRYMCWRLAKTCPIE